MRCDGLGFDIDWTSIIGNVAKVGAGVYSAKAQADAKLAQIRAQAAIADANAKAAALQSQAMAQRAAAAYAPQYLPALPSLQSILPGGMPPWLPVAVLAAVAAAFVLPRMRAR